MISAVLFFWATKPIWKFQVTMSVREQKGGRVCTSACIKKDIHYKGDVGQSIISNKAAASVSFSTFLMATHFFSLPNLSSSIISGQMCDSKAH